MGIKFDYDKPVTNCPACGSTDLSVVMRYLVKNDEPVLEEGVHCNKCGFGFSGTVDKSGKVLDQQIYQAPMDVEKTDDHIE